MSQKQNAPVDRAPLERFNLDGHFDGLDQTREFVLASDHDQRVHDLETLCDPAGIVVENALLKHQTKELGAMIDRLRNEVDASLAIGKAEAEAGGGAVSGLNEWLQ